MAGRVLMLPRSGNQEPEIERRMAIEEESADSLEKGLMLLLAVLMSRGRNGLARSATTEMPGDGLAFWLRNTLELGLVSGIALAEDQLALADVSINRHHIAAMQSKWLDTTFVAQLALINATTARAINRLLIEMDEGGYSLVWLESQLLDYFSAERARKIAATEITRSYVWGAISAYMASRVVPELEWMTANDERVCRICRPLHGIRVPIGRGFGLIGYPPAHIWCRCVVLPVFSLS